MHAQVVLKASSVRLVLLCSKRIDQLPIERRGGHNNGEEEEEKGQEEEEGVMTNLL